MSFREPTEQEKSSINELLPLKLQIYWEGDDIYYPGIAKSVDNEGLFIVIYDEADEVKEDGNEAKEEYHEGKLVTYLYLYIH